LSFRLVPRGGTCSLLAALLLAGCSSSPPPEESLACTGAVLAAAPTTPIEIGLRELASAQGEAKSVGPICVVSVAEPRAAAALAAASVMLDARPESFAILAAADRTWVIGRDATGAMYGAIELAERLRASAAALPLGQPIFGAPAVAVRAANLFLVLPAPSEESSWFQDLAFWREYLDLLARARMNFLDMHGMYNLDNTLFPNALLYFARSPSYPDLGAPADVRDRNVAVLCAIVDMARARGIRVGLMSYSADLSLTGRSPPQRALDEEELRRYTREAVADLARRVPGLSRLGFRIGESGRDAAWYKDTFIAGVHDAGTKVGIYTRTWGTTKPEVLSIAAAIGGDLLVEAKYNGEHLGPPYIIAGGLMASEKWAKYSYEDYLDPPVPYTFLFQVRAGGTHRIFRNASFERARRVARSFSLGSAQGFSLEAAHAYSPQRDFYHAAVDRYSRWTFRRDEIEYLLFGRLAYDPETPEQVFREALAARVGTDALWGPLQAATDIVDWIQTAHTCGPDHRDLAPELELGGPVAYWAAPADAKPPPHACARGYHGPFDTFAFASPFEAASDLLTARATTRVSPLEVARRVLDAAAAARAAGRVVIEPENAEARDVVRQCVAIADLGDYFGHKLRAATALAVYGGSARRDYLTAARAETRRAAAAWKALAVDTAYIAPFEENLRMTPLGISPFHWSAEVPRLAEDFSSIDAFAAQVAQAAPTSPASLPPAAAWLAAPRARGPGLAALTVSSPDGAASFWTVTVELGGDPPPAARVLVWWKRFSGRSDWASEPAAGEGRRYQVRLAGLSDGAMLAVEVVGPVGAGFRYPDVLRETPYVTVPPRP
jgi:hypothetical protein